MSWTEFASAIARDDVVILPVGSTEEHGPQNPLGTDYLIAKELAKQLGEATGALVAPAIPVGNAEGLTDFPGTISLDPALLQELVVNVCVGFIRHGAKRFFIVNGHGGNNAALRFAAMQLYEKHGVLVTSSEWWQLMPQISEFKAHDHGGKFETSMMLAIDESIVDMEKCNTVQIDRLTDGITFDYGFFFQGARLSLNLPTSMTAPSGNFGAPSEEAQKEIGEGMMKAYVDYCAGIVREMRGIHL
jgi:creatinine amidohydrolase